MSIRPAMELNCTRSSFLSTWFDEFPGNSDRRAIMRGDVEFLGAFKHLKGSRSGWVLRVGSRAYAVLHFVVTADGGRRPKGPYQDLIRLITIPWENYVGNLPAAISSTPSWLWRGDDPQKIDEFLGGKG